MNNQPQNQRLVFRTQRSISDIVPRRKLEGVPIAQPVVVEVESILVQKNEIQKFIAEEHATFAKVTKKSKQYTLRAKNKVKTMDKDSRTLAFSAAAGIIAFGLLIGVLFVPSRSSKSDKLVKVASATLPTPAIVKDETKTTAVRGIQTTNNVLDDRKLTPEMLASYQTADQYPRYLQVSSVGIEKSRILRSGVDRQGIIDLPKNIWDTGWYDQSSLPDDKKGAMLLTAYVVDSGTPALFYNLYRIKENDEIIVTMGDNTELRYKVVDKKDIPDGAVDMKALLASRDPNATSLVLLTAAGEFNVLTKQYENRQAAFAVRL